MEIEEAKRLFVDGIKIHPRTELYNNLLQATSHLPTTFLPRQRLWHLVNQTDIIPSCKECGKVVKWDSAQPTHKQGYRAFCSVTCARRNKEVNDKKIRTELLRYGKNRIEITKKIISTNLLRYGESHAIKLQTFKEKQQQTNIKKYGVRNVICNDSIKQKRFETFKNKYGVRSFAQLHLSKDVINKINDKQWLFDLHVNNKKSIIEIATLLNVNYEIITRALKHFNIPITHHTSTSLCERQIIEYIKSLLPNSEIITNDKTILEGKQLDVYIKDKQIAFEINGIFWHSEVNGKTSSYHINKTEQCQKKGIQLIHIFENEWYDKKEIVQSMIKNLLGCTTEIIHARNCEIKEINTKTAQEFLIKNHIQGPIYGKINLGLFYKNKLVCLMVFSRSRFSSNYQYELYRFCSLLHTRVVGGATKLLTHFIKTYKPSSIISYCDLRWSRGNIYRILNFFFLHNTKPNYWYFKIGDYKLFSRLSFQKHKLKNKLNSFNPNLSEWENMQNNGYSRIWDCGNSVWVWLSQ